MSILLAASALYPMSAKAAPFWDWQLQGRGVAPEGVRVLGLDPDETYQSRVRNFEARGIDTICYVSVGTMEEWRGDVEAFPAAVIGNEYANWKGEYFLDIRQIDILLPIMIARFQRCKAMGFSAIEPDNLDVHINNSGFRIHADDVVDYVTELAYVAHEMGLEIGQKNVPELTSQLSQLLDFVITESCFADGWCSQVLEYANRNKPVFAAEYLGAGVDFAAACAYGARTGIHFIQKDLDLTTRLTACD